jgi:hypothetical protein
MSWREAERAEAVIELLRFHGPMPRAYGPLMLPNGWFTARAEELKRELAVAHIAWRHILHRDESSARRI